MSELVATIVAADGAGIEPAFLGKFYKDGKLRKGFRLAWVGQEQNNPQIGKALDVFCSTMEIRDLYAFVSEQVGGRLCDVIVQLAAHRHRDVAVFDMESTVIQNEMLDEMGDRIGIGAEIKALTHGAMYGKLDFVQNFCARVAKFTGRQEELLREVAKSIKVNKGAAELVAMMSKSYLISSGFSCFIEPVARHLNFTGWHGNHLLVKNGIITGEIVEPVQDGASKQRIMVEACQTLGFSLSRVLAAGDGKNDLPMLKACQEAGGLAVAYRTKSADLKAEIINHIVHGDLTTLIYAQGRVPEPIRRDPPPNGFYNPDP